MPRLSPGSLLERSLGGPRAAQIVDATGRVRALCWPCFRWDAPRVQAQVVPASGAPRSLQRAFAACLCFPLARLGFVAGAPAVGDGLEAVVRAASVMTPALVPPARKLACNAWALGSNVASCRASGGVVQPDPSPSFACEGLRGMRRAAWSRIDGSPGVHARLVRRRFAGRAGSARRTRR